MAFTGRTLVLSDGTTTIAGLRATAITINNQTLDVTTKDSAGIRQLLSAKIAQSMTITADGIAEDSVTLKTVRDAAIASTATTFKITTAGDPTAGVTYTGTWIVTSFSESGNHDNAQGFSLTLESASTITVAALP